MVLMKVDKYGETIWTREFADLNDQKASALLVNPSGGYLVVGDTRGEQNDLDAALLWTNEAGELLHQARYGGSETDLLSSAVAMDDGGFMLAGSSASQGAGALDLWLLRVAADGAVLWERFYGSEGNDSASDIARMKDGNVAVVGTYDRSLGIEDPHRRGKIWVFTADAAGDTLWSRIYSSTATIQQGEGIALRPNGDLLVTGQGAPDPLSTVFGCRIMCLSPAGELLWSRTHTGIGNAWGNAIAVLDDGGCYVVGSTMMDLWESPTYAYIIRADALGHEQWSETIAPPGALALSGNAVLAVDEGACLVAGTHYLSYGYSDTEWWIARRVH
jgi:hypothetical protein